MTTGAESDAERAIEHARENRDPQAFHPDLSMAALLLQSTGNEQRADETLSEALGGLRELHRFGFAANDLPSLAWVAVMRGREPELIELVERESFVSPWLRATAAVLAHDFRGGGGDLRRDGDVRRTTRSTGCAPRSSWLQRDDARRPTSSFAPRSRSTGRFGRRGTCARARRCSPPVPSSMRAS